MKQLLRYSSTLLRTALLFGVLAFVNFQTLAQVYSNIEGMPDAFEERDAFNNLSAMIDYCRNGGYYYIQFYGDSFCSYLTDCGVINGNPQKAKTKDFLPSANRLWALEAAGDGVDTHFKLRSKEGHYIAYVGGLEGLGTNQYRFGCVTESENATILTCEKVGDDYFILDTSDTETPMLGRGSDYVWATDITKFKYDSVRRPYGRMRFVKLKSNAAFIIYYRGEGTDNDNPNVATTRHYLTYSGTDFASRITNGDMENGDVSCFYFGDPDHSTAYQANITDGVGTSNGTNNTRGITITSSAAPQNPQEWDTQFFIRANQVIPVGTKVHVEFDFKASQSVTIATQAHSEPGNYNHWACIGDVNFTTEWQHFSTDLTVSDAMGYGTGGDKNNSFQTIAFNLWKGSAITYNFDNIVFSVQLGSDVSSRRSIIPSDKPLSTLPTLAAYHQDGLWTLEETSTEGEFYIKKYESTDEYLKADGMQSILDTKSDVFGKYKLVDPAANRYTLVQNITYQTDPLNINMFHDYRNGGDVQGNQAVADFHIGDNHTLSDGNAVVGNDWMVHYQIYADLSSYTTMVIKGTPGMRLRAIFNRQPPIDPNAEGYDSSGSTFTELTPTIGDDGTAIIDISGLGQRHLNAIKVSSGNGTIGAISLVNRNSTTAGDPTCLNYGSGDGQPVLQRSGYDNNYWYAGFYPVEVPVPNKDNHFQVLVRLRSDLNQMVNYSGTASPYSADPNNRILWQLEQVDDFGHFRLKRPDTGQYLAGYNRMTEPNDPEGQSYEGANKAEVYENTKFFDDFFPEWYIPTKTVSKEIPVVDGSNNLYLVTHKKSYLQQYAQPGLDKQGLATDADDDWWNYDNSIQKTNHFEITHYVKKGNTMTVEFPTVLNSNNDHIFFQRFYHYNDESCDNDLYPDGTDIEGLKAHVSLDTRDDGDVQYFLYKNGMVTGKEPVVKGEVVPGGLAWTGIEKGGYARNVQRRFNFTNSDGKAFTVAVDVSRYTDFTYYNDKDGNGKPVAITNPDPTACKLEEPSLTMRYLYYMKDAKDMAKELTSYTEQPGVRDASSWKEEDETENRKVCVDVSKWRETKEFHFPAKTVAYENGKWVGYRGEFIGLRHVFSDYWVFNDGNPNSTDDNNLVSAVNNNSDGKIEVRIYDPNGTGIRLGGWNPTLANANNGTLKFVDDGVYTDEIDNDFKGFYFYDKMAYPNPKTSYGDSRFVVFRYPAEERDGETVVHQEGEARKTGAENPAYIHVYLNNNGTRYQLAQYTLIFDKDAEMIPYTSVNGSSYVKDATDNPHKFRDPHKLREAAGEPIAKITFDYPENTTYHYPLNCYTRHDGGDRFVDSDGTLHEWVYNSTEEKWEERTGSSIISSSSPVPLTFDNTNYAFDGDGCNWGSYALVAQKSTVWGNGKLVRPVDVAESAGGYGIDPDAGMQRGFLYIDASEQPGDICAVDFQGEFCAGDKLMCTGWISGSNTVGGYRCPGGITMTVKGENLETGKKETIYRFCPGQCYELDNGTGSDGSTNATQVVWQQFYFEFGTTKKYRRYWMEVNNNCVSSNGGDFMLDNVEVYALVPEVIPEMNTPLCIDKDVSDMQLLKINIGFDKIIAATDEDELTGTNSKDMSIAFVFLEKDKFLTTFQKNLSGIGVNKTIAQLEDIIESGDFEELVKTTYKDAYRNAFKAAKLGDITHIWDSKQASDDRDAGILNYHWNTNFSEMETYTFAKAVNRLGTVFGETDPETGERFIVMNGNYPNKLPWKVNVDYYIVPYTAGYTETQASEDNLAEDDFFADFNICSRCSKKAVFQIKPSLQILSTESSDVTQDLEVCEGKIPTVLTNLTGYDIEGKEVPMKDLNFDWWLGDATYTEQDPNDATKTIWPKLATLENYYNQEKNITVNGVTKLVRLDESLSYLRVYYRDATSLDGIIEKVDQTPNLTVHMITYLRELVEKGELVLHQKSVNIPAVKSGDDPYFYLVACPIHDEMFDQALHYVDTTDPSHPKDRYVAYFCSDPQGLRMKLGDKAPTLQCGFVPGENGFDAYGYDGNPVLSVRLAKAAQFETVQHGKVNDNPGDDYNTTADADIHFLWLPIRNAKIQTAGSEKVIRKSGDCNVYLASSDDPTWDQAIYAEMTSTGTLPIVGKIVTLNAIDKAVASGSEEDLNRLCIYFIKYLTSTPDENKVFKVREGYNYTLSLPFREDGDGNTCDGTILVNVKIVPDYEVWTGAAGNTDWNNDQNWRRADGNTEDSSGLNGDELYRANGALDDADSPLYVYTTNAENYYTKKKNQAKPSRDQVLRRGFAPLYCTHVLMMSDEWGNAPVLYDAIDGNALNATTNSRLTNAPFPNLRDYDGWDGTAGTPATATPILRFDMQTREYSLWEDTYGIKPNKGVQAPESYKGRNGDLLAEMYQINSCDEIVFQPGTELRNAHLLNYNTAWVEYELDSKRWYLLGSPLQGTIAGEWYAPTGTSATNNAPQQNTTYYDPVTFNATKYDRYNPAIYQRSWDKAKAVLYEIGANYSTTDNPNNLALEGGSLSGSILQGEWGTNGWTTTAADRYLDRIGYKPFGNKKVNVAIQGIWSNTYNDATVDYTKGGFSVMVMNHLKGNADEVKAIIRLPKEDTMYDYWSFDQNTHGTNTNLEGDDGVRTILERNLNRGRLKTDLLLPVSTQKDEDTDGKFGDLRYGKERSITRVPIKEGDLTTMLGALRIHGETISPGISDMGFYLVENPFQCGLDMDKFFSANHKLYKKYWLLTSGGQQLVQWATTGWVTPTIPIADDEETTYDYADDDNPSANAVLAPGQGFFVQYNPEYKLVSPETTRTPPTEIVYSQDMQAQSRFGVIDDAGTEFEIVVGTEQSMVQLKDENNQPVYTTVDLNDNGIFGETGITIEGKTVDELEPVMIPEYESDGVTPKTNPLYDKVTIYKYKQTTNTNLQYPLRSRTRGAVASNLPGLVITAQRGTNRSSALVMKHGNASNDFLPEEDTEVFITSDLEHVPTVYTLCGRLATTINSIHDFSFLPVGVESNSDALCTLTFKGVEMLGDSIAFYDAVERKLTPLESGMTFEVSGQTQNRYYLVRSLIQEEAAAETHLQIFTEGLTAKVIASTAEPITNVRCYDTAGRLIHSASPQTPAYSFSLPRAGIYIIDAETENDHKTKKVMTK